MLPPAALSTRRRFDGGGDRRESRSPSMLGAGSGETERWHPDEPMASISKRREAAVDRGADAGEASREGMSFGVALEDAVSRVVKNVEREGVKASSRAACVGRQLMFIDSQVCQPTFNAETMLPSLCKKIVLLSGLTLTS